MKEPTIYARTFDLMADVLHREDADDWLKLFKDLMQTYHQAAFEITGPEEVRELIAVGRAVKLTQRQDPITRR